MPSSGHVFAILGLISLWGCGDKEAKDSGAGDCATDAATWFPDADGDGYGDSEAALESCAAPSGHVAQDGDCDDDDPAVHPGASEVCNALDDDCDGLTDDDDDSLDAQGSLSAWPDGDGDGFGAEGSPVAWCETLPDGHVDLAGDCDDLEAGVHPDATEVCNGIDDDCDLLSDDEDPDLDPSTTSTWYADVDGDGEGDAETAYDACQEPESSAANDSDCDDTDAAIWSGATEVCDGVDNDCDGLTDDDDDSLDQSTTLPWYADRDGDGFGDASKRSESCDAPADHVDDDTDCYDKDAGINPAATEVCDVDNTDEDCNGLADDDDSALDTSTWSTWYTDGDGDGYGDSASPQEACEQPSSTAVLDGDCDDADADLSPGATEVCDVDDTDEDCDGLADDDDSSVDTSTWSTWYTDGDGDGYGDSDSSWGQCDASSGSSLSDGDCDDTDSGISPGEAEDCTSGSDDDCDSLVDCEDGDCAADPACVESDCSDGSDNDSDGDTDCEDDDCIGVAACTTVAVATRVAGGSGKLRRSTHYRKAWGLPRKSVSGSFATRQGEQIKGTLTSLSGTIYVGNGSSPSVATSLCVWHATDIKFKRSQSDLFNRNFDHVTYATTRTTVGSSWLSSACPLASGEFLPSIIFPMRSGIIHAPRAPSTLLGLSSPAIFSAKDGARSWAYPLSSSIIQSTSVWSSWETVTTYGGASSFLATDVGSVQWTSMGLFNLTGGNSFIFY